MAVRLKSFVPVLLSARTANEQRVWIVGHRHLLHIMPHLSMGIRAIENVRDGRLAETSRHSPALRQRR